MSHKQQTTLPIHYFGKSGLALLKLPFVMVFVLCVVCMGLLVVVFVYQRQR